MSVMYLYVGCLLIYLTWFLCFGHSSDCSLDLRSGKTFSLSLQYHLSKGKAGFHQSTLQRRYQFTVMTSPKERFPEEQPSSFKFETPITFTSLDGTAESSTPDDRLHLITDLANAKSDSNASETIDESHQMGSVSIRMPCSPLGVNIEDARKVLFSRSVGTGSTTNAEELPAGKSRIDRLKDKRFDSFKTWSGKFERQLSHLRGKQQEPDEDEANVPQNAEMENLPVHRYFDALKGPELETLRDTEELVLPKDRTWPFLLRFPVSAFSICLGVSSQAILWKALATSPSTRFLHISMAVNLILWWIAVIITSIVFFIYFLKVVFYFEAVRREYFHPIRVNFFFAPWVTLLFLALGIPPSHVETLHAASWYILMTPILCLELKIYGQWMSGGQRRLSKVANPSNHLSIIGNFVGALLGASNGLKEGPIFFFGVGLAHYVVLFVTLYQRLPTNETLPKELHPVFFLFVAGPSVASMAWARIQGTFDYGSKICYFIGLFLYCSLAVRINFFRGFRFSLAWWAYTFPMAGASIATIRYSNVVKNPLTQTMSVILSAISTCVVTALLISTVYHAFVLQNLFPNDIVIAIAQKKAKPSKKFPGKRKGLKEGKNNESSLTPTTSSDSKDIESSLV
ncbi:S-type anion channel SLAH2-like isoform X2 [Papaver somniferum]|uniref:S-type anion channel SLAH2-like isoform X2 n=1 Tax=Papaver somniferum TaxID=3469 RepID=UPI000E6FFB88|nr:S-type anion channel SLAH2-like isoform X2 [Papaver somniferum]